MPRGDAPPVSAEQLRMPRRRRKRPLHGTQLAFQYRSARRWASATLYARRHNASLGADAPTLSFYPSRPTPRTQIVRILALLAVRIGFDPGAAGPVIAWDGGAWFDPRAAARLPAGTINGRCLDVSKSTVQRVWAEVAGYALAVDPLTHRGPIVVKSELNGMHDGRLVEGPLATRAPGLVYERLVDTGRDGVLSTIRTPVIGGRVPVTMVKWRPAPAWFGSAALTEPRPAGDMFSPAELELLARFAERLGMDYGELDVLREAATDRIFVVDANRTPVRNPRLRSAFDADIYPAMAEAFRALLPG